MPSSRQGTVAIPADVVRELDRHPHLSPDARIAIEAALDGVPALVRKSRAAEVLDCSERQIGRILARTGAGFKLNPDQRGAVRIPRALLARVLAEGAA